MVGMKHFHDDSVEGIIHKFFGKAMKCECELPKVRASLEELESVEAVDKIMLGLFFDAVFLSAVHSYRRGSLDEYLRSLDYEAVVYMHGGTDRVYAPLLDGVDEGIVLNESRGIVEKWILDNKSVIGKSACLDIVDRLVDDREFLWGFNKVLKADGLDKIKEMMGSFMGARSGKRAEESLSGVEWWKRFLVNSKLVGQEFFDFLNDKINSMDRFNSQDVVDAWVLLGNRFEDEQLQLQFRAYSASKAWQKVVDLGRERLGTDLLIGEYGAYLYAALAELGQYEEASVVAAKYMRESGDDDALMDYAKLLFMAGQYEKVIKKVGPIIDEPMLFNGQRSTFAALLLRTESLRLLGRYKEAWEDLKAVYQVGLEIKTSEAYMKLLGGICLKIRKLGAGEVGSEYGVVVRGGEVFL